MCAVIYLYVPAIQLIATLALDVLFASKCRFQGPPFRVPAEIFLNSDVSLPFRRHSTTSDD